MNFTKLHFCHVDEDSTYLKQISLEDIVGKEIDNLQDEITKKDEEFLSLNRNYFSLEVELSVLKKEAGENETMISYLEEQKTTLKYSLKREKECIERMETDKNDLKKTLELIASREYVWTTHLVERAKHLHQMLANEKMKTLNLENNVCTFQTTINKQKEELELQQSAMHAQQAQQNETIGKLELQVNGMKQNIVTLEKIIDTLRKERRDIIQSTEMVRKDLETKITNQQKIITTNGEQIASMKHNHDDVVSRLNDDIKNLKKTIADKQTEAKQHFDLYEDQLFRKDNDMDCLRTELQTCKEELA